MRDRLKVLACSDSFYPPRGGGDISFRDICRSLNERGDAVTACYVGSQSDPVIPSIPLPITPCMRGIWPRIWEMGYRWKARFGTVLRAIDPDVVLAQKTVLFDTIEVCRRANVPAVALLCNVDPLCLGSFWSGHPWKCQYKCIGCRDAGPRIVQYPFFIRLVVRFRSILRQAAAVVVNSEFMKDTLSEIWGIESEVVHPTIDIPAVPNPLRRGENILFFFPLDYKGVATAIGIARAMPEEQFLFVGYGKTRTINQLSTVRNIEYVPWMQDPAPVYERAKLLIVPSLIPEGYGRVCVEAMARGIPCVVSGVGALPSTVGSGGDVVANHTSVKAWVSTLVKYRDEGYLKEKSRMAWEEARRRSEKEDPSRILAIVDRVAQLKSCQ